MLSKPTRRELIQTAITGTATLGLGSLLASPLLAAEHKEDLLYKISIAEYSFHRMIAAGKLDPLDFGPFCRQEFGVDAVEYWMGPFSDKATDKKYMGAMKQRSDDAGVKGLLIMIDGEGALGDPDESRRNQAVANHHKWIEAAKEMACHSIRVNAQSEGTRDEQMRLAADGLRQLSEFAASYDINVIVENHGGLSSDGNWVASVMKLVDLPNCGTLPDFGNFHDYDRYRGVQEMMPWAKAVSAKSQAFDASGNETGTDFLRMMKIVTDAGYHGYVGIEWEGGKPDEIEGTRLTQRLLERVRTQLDAS
ncbi:MAG: sugar phosphate isomerase/epimerase [Pirellulales bacterium]|nr:sugar phosphate isomerase/epimerase [Pirellulales bacterium]